MKKNKIKKKILIFTSLSIFNLSCSHFTHQLKQKTRVPNNSFENTLCTQDLLKDINANHPVISLIQNNETKLTFMVSEKFLNENNLDMSDLKFSIFKSGFDTDKEFNEGTSSIELIEKNQNSISKDPVYKWVKIEIEKNELMAKLNEFNVENNDLKIPFTGGYEIVIYKKTLLSNKEIFRTKFFINQNLKLKEEVNSETINQLAFKYAPILSYTETEEFNPSSLEYIFNNENLDLQIESFHITGYPSQETPVFNYSDLKKYLPFYSNSKSSLKIGAEKLNAIENGAKKTLLNTLYGKDNSIRTVYFTYQYLNSKETKYKPWLIINYHFIYPFDYKNSVSAKDPVWAAHAFDRESLSLLFQIKSSNEFQLDSAIYGAHLASQKMGLINPFQSEILKKNNSDQIQKILSQNNSKDDSSQFLQSWLNGRVMVLNTELKKHLSINDHPMAMLAQGSHGVYPIPGDYAVILGAENKLLVETAGGSQIIVPENSGFNTEENSTYQLKPLITDELSACSENSILNYSGSFVDVQGLTNAEFPPFTERESNIQKYISIFRTDKESEGAFKVEILENELINTKINEIKKRVKDNKTN